MSGQNINSVGKISDGYSQRESDGLGRVLSLDGVALLLLQDHIEGCVAEAIREERGEEVIRELMNVIRRSTRH